MSQKKYYYRVDLDIPSHKLDFMKENAEKHRWGPHPTKEGYWTFQLGPFSIEFDSPKEYVDIEVQPYYAFITSKPLEEDNININLALFLKHILMLCDGLYIDMIAAERIEAEATDNQD